MIATQLKMIAMMKKLSSIKQSHHANKVKSTQKQNTRPKSMSNARLRMMTSQTSEIRSPTSRPNSGTLRKSATMPN